MGGGGGNSLNPPRHLNRVPSSAPVGLFSHHALVFEHRTDHVSQCRLALRLACTVSREWKAGIAHPGLNLIVALLRVTGRRDQHHFQGADFLSLLGELGNCCSGLCDAALSKWARSESWWTSKHQLVAVVGQYR